MSSFSRAAKKVLDDIKKILYLGSESGRSTIVWAFEHIPAGSIVLEIMVDNYFEGFSTTIAEDSSLAALAELPPAFIRRVLFRFHEEVKSSECKKSRDRCCIEHENEAEKDDCEGLHMRYCEKTDRAYFD